MRSLAAALAVLLFAASFASALTPAAEKLLRKLGLDPRSEEIAALAGDRVAAKNGKVYTLDALAAKGDTAAVKAFLVTREFFHAFLKDPDIEFPNDELYDVRYLTEAEKLYMGRKLMEGLPSGGKAAPAKSK